MNELRACPFCGGKARYIPMAVTVQCFSCYCHTPSFDEPQAIADWNRRTQSVTREKVKRVLCDAYDCACITDCAGLPSGCALTAADAILALFGESPHD